MDNPIFHNTTPRLIVATTRFRETPTDLYVQKFGANSQALVSCSTGTNSSAYSWISAASSLLLAALPILILNNTLLYALNFTTNWNWRVSWLFLPPLTILRPNNVDRPCPEYDSDSAGTRQGNSTSLQASMQPCSTVPSAAGCPRTTGRKRPGDDGSDAEDNDRGGKRPRNIAADKSKAIKVPCPFKKHYPDDPEFEKCGPFYDYNRLREHLLTRKHKPRDRCPTCGKIFYVDDEWKKHTGKQACQQSLQPLKSPSWVNKHQAAEIRKLSSRGVKSEVSLEEMYHKVCRILFDSDITPARTASGHPTLHPHFQHTNEFEINDRPQESWNMLARKIGDRPGMEVVPYATILQIIDDVVHHLESSKPRNPLIQSHETESGEAALEEYSGTNEASFAHCQTPLATLSQGQVPLIQEPEGWPGGPSDGHLVHTSTYVHEGAIHPGPMPNNITSSAIFSYPPSDLSMAFTPGSETTQVSDAALLRPLWRQTLEDANGFNSGEILNTSGKLDLGLPMCVDPRQLLIGGAVRDEDDQDRNAPSCSR